jgi:hypothetical protein
VPMHPAVQSMVAVTYVRDIDASRSFYELLGFAEQSAGKAEKSAWSALHQGSHSILLVSTRPTLKIPQLPLLSGQLKGDAAEEEDESRFSLLREAAAVVAAGGGAPSRCTISEPGGQPCGAAAEVRLADAAGTAAWSCLAHAEEILVMVPGSFVAADADDGIAGFLARRGG